MSRRLLERFVDVRRRINLVATQLVAPLEIGTKQFAIARQLGKLGAATASELARLTFSDAAAVTRAVDSLVARGWAARKAHPSDRRQRQIVLTAEGKRNLASVDQVYEELADRFEAALSPKERRELDRLLGVLAESLESPIEVARSATIP